jgi:hypothetical protein
VGAWSSQEATFFFYAGNKNTPMSIKWRKLDLGRTIRLRGIGNLERLGIDITKHKRENIHLVSCCICSRK